MTREFETHTLQWNGIDITLEFDPDWSRAYREIYGSAMTLMQIRSEGRQPLPITETGYRSAFVRSTAMAEFDGPVAYLRAWLDAEASGEHWQLLCHAQRQGTLF